MAHLPKFDVALALINHQGKTLLGMRAQSAHAGGKFEFIGGKVEAGETPRQAIKRECLEELGVGALTLKNACTLGFAYPDRLVQLHVFWVTLQDDEPRPLGTESLHWVDLGALDQLPMPEANLAIKKVAQLPNTFHITPDLELKKIDATAKEQGSNPNILTTDTIDQWMQDRLTLPVGALVYVRLKNLNLSDYIQIFNKLAEARPDLKLVCEYRAWQKLASVCFAAQLSSYDLMGLSKLPDPSDANLLWFASVHSEDQIACANQLGVHAVTLSPIKPTPSHPEVTGLGWQRATELAMLSCCTVYALGGVSPSDLDRLQSTNFFGVAGIRHFKSTTKESSMSDHKHTEQSADTMSWSELSKDQQTELEAAAFRRLTAHLQERTDVQNIDLMNLAGFCRNCLSKWLAAAAADEGINISVPEARATVYNMPYEIWKDKYQV